MNLKDWLDKKRWSHSKLADEVGVDRSQVTRWAAGDTVPRRETMRLITTATKGKVSGSDFY